MFSASLDLRLRFLLVVPLLFVAADPPPPYNYYEYRSSTSSPYSNKRHQTYVDQQYPPTPRTTSANQCKLHINCPSKSNFTLQPHPPHPRFRREKPRDVGHSRTGWTTGTIGQTGRPGTEWSTRFARSARSRRLHESEIGVFRRSESNLRITREFGGDRLGRRHPE